MKRSSPPQARNLALIGGRGCGKSSVARRILGKEKRFTLWSLDALIRYEADGLPIPEIVATRGWSKFREIEKTVVRRVTKLTEWQLIDCGGGVVVDLDESGQEVFSTEKVEALRRDSVVIYLQRDFAFLEEKIRGDRNRPELSADNSFLEIMQRRDPWYRQAAHAVVDARNLRKHQIAGAVLQQYYDTTGILPPGQRDGN